MESDTARAGFAWVVGLLAWSVLAASDPAPICVDPAEIAASAGHTTAVRCGATDAEDGLRGPARRLFGLGVDLNCADPATLETLTGIGPARARAIVAERERAPFDRVDELVRVRGIGPATLASLRAELIAGSGHADGASVPSAECRSTQSPPERGAKEPL